ncbi:Na+/H+ antiporter subunit E [Nesterenkonia ebinurensis]|uniref:Na+/H+ antiporter subunit E n=1 Tax=Nesterenkonia ebinurensis TaxID=2608252 RepID=UPI00123CFF60|nr:Na+/H+ antiporter subunit E [Nesterenkonia ebinurensis]
MTKTFRRFIRLPGFLMWFIWEMIRANWQVAADILTPGSALTPAIVAYQTRGLTPKEITALSNLITLTPGTLTIDIDESPGQGQILYVLGLYAPAKPEDFHTELRELENKLLYITRISVQGDRAEVRR